MRSPGPNWSREVDVATGVEEAKAQLPLPYKREVAVWGTAYLPGGRFEIEYKT